MHQPNRRRFLKQVGAFSTAATVALPAYARTHGTAERISVGVIGCGSRDSVALVHLANIATRLGRSLHVDTVRDTIQGDEEATRLLTRDYRDGGHWAIPKGV